MTLAEAFRDQGRACATMGSPFMGRLMTLVADRLAPGTPVTDAILQWPGDPRTNADNVPLRLAGALHALKLEGLALGAVYPPEVVDDDTLWSAIAAAMQDHAARILLWLQSPPQTNEVRRAAALLPALHEIARLTDRPLDLVELGCSGGLNLQADRMALDLAQGTLGDPDSPLRLAPDWSGPVPAPTPLGVRHRTGIDLNPIDPATAEGRLRLLAYLWPDQPDRIARTEAAIALARTAPPPLLTGDAPDALAPCLANRAADATTVVFHTVAWQYFPADTARRTRTLISEEGARATTAAPLAWLSFETDGKSPGGALGLTLWPGGRRHELGRADFHGRWVDWSGLSAAS